MFLSNSFVFPEFWIPSYVQNFLHDMVDVDVYLGSFVDLDVLGHGGVGDQHGGHQGGVRVLHLNKPRTVRDLDIE